MASGKSRMRSVLPINLQVKATPVNIRRLVFLSLFFFVLNNSHSQTDEINSLLEEVKNKNLDMWDFTDYVAERIESTEKIANFFYHWIRQNITYDYQILEQRNNGTISQGAYRESQDEYDVYENRRGVCYGYANLYHWFLEEFEIEVEIISGYIRDSRNHYINLEEDNDFRHAWNAVKLNGKWILVDTTWGSNLATENAAYYYDIPPEWLINTHFPSEHKWQLLDKPLSLEEFNNSKYINQVWYQLGFSEAPKLLKDEDYYYFQFIDAATDWTVSLDYSNDNSSFSHVKVEQVIKQEGYVYYKFKKESIGGEAYFKVGLLLLENDEGGFSTRKYADLINFKNY